MSSLDAGQDYVPWTTNVGQEPENPAAGLARLVFPGDGEMPSLMRAFDWRQTPLGAVENWPQSLRTSVSICLASRFPIVLYWGPEYVVIYNDAYSQILGAKHPWALGQTCRTCWAEIWDTIGPMLDEVVKTGAATWSDDLLLMLERFGYREECYFSFSFSPVMVESGLVGGIFTAVIETTDKVIGERRLQTLRELAACATAAKTERDVWRTAVKMLADNDKDLPFTVLCKVAGDRFQVTGTAGISPTHALCQSLCEPESELFDEAIEVARSGTCAEVEHLALLNGELPSGAWDSPPNRALLLPIAALGQGVSGVLIAAISPAKALDEKYRTFLDLAARQIATSVADARSFEEERKRAESLAELDRAKTLFFSNISHELRTPLTLLLGPTESAISSKDRALKGADLEMVHRNELRLLKLVNTLLDFSRIEAGRVQATFQPTDLCTLTTDIASAFRSAMEAAGLEYTVSCEPIDEPIYVDRQMWEKIVLNLLSNAFKFTFEGHVQLTLRRVENAIELIVRDSGVGIPQDQLPRIFERFHRVENVRARTYEGTGIGLSLVQELVKLHGGSVHVESAPAAGSSFHVTVPTGTAHLPADRIHSSTSFGPTPVSSEAYIEEAQRWISGGSADPLGVSSIKDAERHEVEAGSIDQRDVIVIADDNADMREYLLRLLCERYIVHTVKNGIEAIEATRRLRPALVLTDVMMPGIDGFGVLTEIRSDEALRSTPVILLSARAGEESRVEGLHAGADDYLIKPFTAEELVARVTTHVNMANMRRQAAERESRLRAQADLERRRFQELLAQAPAAIGVLNGPDHRWIYVNNESVRLTGRESPADFLGKTLSESLPEMETQVYVRMLDEVYRAGKPFVGREMKAILKRSERGLPDESYWDFVYQPICDVDGVIEGILVHGVEVTERVLSRRAIETSERKFRDLAETTTIAVHWVGPDGTILWANRAELEMLGYKAEEYIGHNIAEFHVDAPVLKDILSRLCRGETLREHHARLRAKNGSVRHVVISSSVLFENSNFIHIRCFTRDITDQKIAEIALRESEQKLRVVTEATPVMIWLAGTDKLCHYFNRTWLDFVGRTLEEEKGNGWAGNVHPEDLDRCLQIFTSCFDKREPFEMEYRLRHHSGEYRWILDHGVPRYTPDGTFEGFVGGCLDIHEQKEAAEKVRAAGEAVRRSKELLEVALAASATGTFRWNLQTDAVQIDESLKRLLGLGGHEGIENIRDFIGRVHKDDRVRLNFVVDACRVGADFETEFRIALTNGSYRWLYGRGKIEREDGKLISLVGACTDITSRKNTEETLRESELWLSGQKQAFQAAMDGAPLSESLEVLIRTAVKQFHGEARCAFYIANAAGTELKHVAGMGDEYAQWVDGFKIGPDSLACGLVVHTGEPRITADVRKDPRWKPWLWLAEQYDYRGCWSFPVKTTTGKAIGTFAIYFKEPREATARDLQLANVLTHAAAIIISRHQEAEERARTERVLHENEQRLRLAQQAAGIGTFEWNLRTNENRWTPELEAMYGLAPGGFQGTQEHWEQLVHPEDRSNALKQVETAFQTGAPVQAEWRAVWPDGNTHWILGRWQVFTDESGAPVCMAGINIDVTARKTEEEARRHLAAIVESSKDAIVSKDLAAS